MRTLCARRKRSIETFVKTVTEVWVGNRLSRVVVSDLTRHLETEEELMPNYSAGIRCFGKVTGRVEEIQREYVCPNVETLTTIVSDVQNNVESCNQIRNGGSLSPICVPLRWPR